MSNQKMTELAKSFPTLREADGIDPFIPEYLDEWAYSRASHGGLLAAQFLLTVWSGKMGRLLIDGIKKKEPFWQYLVETPWRCGLFDVVDACGTWDHAHRNAFLAWAANPWWP